MKKLIVLLAMGMFLTSTIVMAGERQKPASDYRVEIKIVYNAVSADKAKRITNEIINRHDKACKVEVESKMVDGDNDTIDFSSYTTTANMICMDEDGDYYECE